jgi:hypothetical protein
VLRGSSPSVTGSSTRSPLFAFEKIRGEILVLVAQADAPDGRADAGPGGVGRHKRGHGDKRVAQRAGRDADVAPAGEPVGADVFGGRILTGLLAGAVNAEIHEARGRREVADGPAGDGDDAACIEHEAGNDGRAAVDLGLGEKLDRDDAAHALAPERGERGPGGGAGDCAAAKRLRRDKTAAHAPGSRSARRRTGPLWPGEIRRVVVVMA